MSHHGLFTYAFTIKNQPNVVFFTIKQSTSHVGKYTWMVMATGQPLRGGRLAESNSWGWHHLQNR